MKPGREKIEGDGMLLQASSMNFNRGSQTRSKRSLRNCSLWNHLAGGKEALREGKEILTLQTLGKTKVSLRKNRRAGENTQS